VWKQGTMNRATSLFLLVVEGRLNEGNICCVLRPVSMDDGIQVVEIHLYCPYFITTGSRRSIGTSRQVLYLIMWTLSFELSQCVSPVFVFSKYMGSSNKPSTNLTLINKFFYLSIPSLERLQLSIRDTYIYIELKLSSTLVLHGG
jgi:hypothetical protein